MLMMRRAIACGFLLFSPCVYGQSGPLERRASSFNSKGVGLTETLLKFSHEEHLPIAIEYVDRASMDRPINVSLRHKTLRRFLEVTHLRLSEVTYSHEKDRKSKRL